MAEWDEILRQRRRERRLTLEEFARALFVEASVAELLQAGRHELTPPMFYRLARTLRFDNDEALIVLRSAVEHKMFHEPLSGDLGDSLAGSLGGGVLLMMLRGEGPDLGLLDRDGRAILDRLAKSLELSHVDIAAMLDVPATDVESWLDGRGRLPLVVLAQLREYADSLDTLERLFRRDRLPHLIRRPAEIFGGRAGIDLIRAGDLRTVASRFDRSLTFQV